jgi:hypothetical protein
MSARLDTQYNQGNPSKYQLDIAMTLENLRKELNPHQKELRQLLTEANDAPKAIKAFLTLHGILHSASAAPEAPWSYEDLLLNPLDENCFQAVPDSCEHSLAWIIWHLSRIEDVTMNLLVAGENQVFENENWQSRINSPIRHTGNAMAIPAVKDFSKAVELPALRAYRHAVGRRTQQIVKQLDAEDFGQTVKSDHLQRVMDEKAVHEEAFGVIDYWSRRTIACLLLMSPTRHAISHWNEARQVIKKL